MTRRTIPLLLCAIIIAPARAAMVRIEAEAAGPSAAANTWTVQDTPEASGGKVLRLPRHDVVVESSAVPLALPHAATYRLFVRYLKQTDAPCTFLTIVRDEDGEALAGCYCDAVSARPRTHPYEGRAKSEHGKGPVWESFLLTAERPMLARVSFMGKVHGGGAYSDRWVDCVIAAASTGDDPTGLDAAALSQLPPPTGTVNPTTAPKGFVYAPTPFPTTQLFSGVQRAQDQYLLGLITCGGILTDPAMAVRLGFNRDHSCGIARLADYGIKAIGIAESYDTVTPEFAKAHPAPEGRVVNAEGKAGTQWSLSYPPLRDELPRVLEERLNRALPYSDAIEAWRVCAEAGGFLDYSSYSLDAFREWLAGKHGDITTLNRRWGSSYASFADITPPKAFTDGRPCWFEFRDFCGREFVNAIGRQVPLIKQRDPQQRDLITQNSNLHLLAPYFTSMAPLDLELLWTEALKDERYACWDGYAADDFIGCEIELVRSLSGGKRPLNQEWSIHAHDPRLAARTFWNYVAKGCAGMHVFEFMADAIYCDEWDKWAGTRSDLTPRDRLAAYSDAAQEVHRLEPLLARAQVTDAVKPVAMLYSRLDLSVAEPFLSLWGHGVDSPAHVFAALRGQGYVVRWVTPRQIEAGALTDFGALVMADCQYVPEAAARKIEQWVRDGGAVIGDRWPGAWNEYAQPQTTLAPVFGVAAPAPTGGGSQLAVQQSSQGYGEVTVRALDPKSLAETVGEVFQQHDATHPVARAMGDFFLAGLGLQRVACTAGDVIGVSYYGTPGVIVNDYGKGSALYSAMMLGTIYESSATPYEWDSAHSGDSLGRLLAAYLRYAGVRSAASVDLANPRVRAKVRVEAPLVTPEGNVLVGLESYNDAPVGHFGLQVQLPPSVVGIHSVFMATGGSRRLTPVAFTQRGPLLKLTAPPFDTHAMIIGVRDGPPLVALDVSGAPRGTAGLLQVTPGCALTLTATVYNASGKTCPGEKLRLILPRGWAQTTATAALPKLAPWGRGSAVFRIQPPAINGGLRLRPILVRYGDSVATEMVWWMDAATGNVGQ